MKTKFNGMLTLLLALVVQFTFAQEKQISGTVSDETGPLPGVSIIIKGTSTGVETDFDGIYSIMAKTGDVLNYSYVGMNNTSKTVGDSNTINVKMTSSNLLDEVVVIAFGTTTKEAFTGSAEVIGSKELELRALTSPIGAIEGATTGIQVLSASGQPGSSPSIIIRGVGTLNGSSDPLFIVDGIQFEGALTSLNQDDIASMTVLKDAASTALYGSRAANGVVLITTKSGKKGSGLTVNFNTSYGVVSKGITEYDAVNPGQYYELMWESYKNSLDVANPAAEASATIFNRLGYNPFNVPNDQIVGVDGKLNPNASVTSKGLNWYDALEQTGSRVNHSLSLSSGGEKHDVYFSTSYLDEKGYVITSKYDRLTTRLNANFQPKKWLKIGGNMNLSFTNQAGPMSRGASIANPFSFAKGMGSIYPTHVVDPNTGEFILDINGEKQYDLGEGYQQYGIQSRPVHVGRHAIAEAEYNSDITEINNLGFRNYAEFTITEGLTAKIIYGLDVNDYINKSYENNIVGDGAPTGRYSEDRYRRTVENFNQVINYKTNIEDHNIEITLGHESFDRHYSLVSGMKNTQTAVGIYEFDNFSQVSNLSGYSTDKKVEGYFSRVNYNYDNRFYVSASVRRDGSSVFAEDVRWGNFYSVGGSWRIDQEKFMENVDWINRLKLRASFGQVGNDDLNDYYLSQARYSLYPNAGEPGIYWSNLGNNALTWETVESWDIALDFGFLDNKIDGSFEYYRKTSSDLLYNVPLALSNGFSEGVDNIATMYNEGFELGITGHIIDKNDFSWDLSVMASTLNNEITEIPQPFVDGSKRWDVGRSRFDYYIYEYAGVDSSNGDALYTIWEDAENGDRVRKLNEDGTVATTHSYQDAGKGYVDKTPLPDVVGSVTNNFKYKNLSLGVTVLYSFGGEFLDYGYAAMMHEGEFGESLHPDMLNAWRKPGDITNVPRLENGAANQLVSQSTRFLTDASYVAIKNINIAYSFNQQITEKLGLNNLRLFVSGENLAMFTKRTGLNPQYNVAGTPSGDDYNPSRVITLGVKVSF